MTSHIYVNLAMADQQPVQHCLPLPLHLGRSHPLLAARKYLLARRHLCIVKRASGLYVQDQGSLLGTRLNGQRVVGEQLLCPDDLIELGPFSLHVLAQNFNPPAAQLEPDDRVDESPVKVHESVSEFADQACLSSQAHLWTAQSRLHHLLLERLDLARRNLSLVSDAALYQEAYEVMGSILAEESGYTQQEKQELRLAVCNEALRLGALEVLLSDPEISEIMVNRYDTIFVERSGRLMPSPVRFSSESALRAILDRILAPLGRRLDEQSPLVDARLRDGSRVHAVVAPIALNGVCVTIRKFPRQSLGLDDWQESGGLSMAMSRFLQMCVRERVNILLVGGTGTGKTSLLNALSAWIPEGERLVTIEDTAELRLAHRNLVALEARPANVEGQGQISLRELLRNALRMRPDRIIIGECRGAEAFDMLSAMNTGHEGSLSTLHANSPRDALTRLESMVLMAGLDLPLHSVREHIASAVQCLVQLQRLPCGRRLISEIAELSGMESGCIQTQSLYCYRAHSEPEFMASGLAIESARLRAQLGVQRLPA